MPCVERCSQSRTGQKTVFQSACQIQLQSKKHCPASGVVNCITQKQTIGIRQFIATFPTWQSNKRGGTRSGYVGQLDAALADARADGTRRIVFESAGGDGWSNIWDQIPGPVCLHSATLPFDSMICEHGWGEVRAPMEAFPRSGSSGEKVRSAYRVGFGRE